MSFFGTKNDWMLISCVNANVCLLIILLSKNVFLFLILSENVILRRRKRKLGRGLGLSSRVVLETGLKNVTKHIGNFHSDCYVVEYNQT